MMSTMFVIEENEDLFDRLPDSILLTIFDKVQDAKSLCVSASSSASVSLSCDSNALRRMIGIIVVLVLISPAEILRSFREIKELEIDHPPAATRKCRRFIAEMECRVW
ncbi:hypothetical protein HAX54_007159 [Datura stramonium]|uniref:F-box domain-containing protein n=1 Tax=Datura stramonium TaxID=4076 RepID=A0ABS8TBD8_DATST|nr:hypothetical protein [Datura stramonium]